MISISNLTPFANLRFSNRNSAGREFGVFMAKTAYDVGRDGICTLSSEQEPFVFTDSYHGELNVSALRYPSDFVPHKPHSEVILDATAYAPGGKASTEWPVSVQVSDEAGEFAAYGCRVTGPRQWQPIWLKQLSETQRPDWRSFRALFRGWELSQASPITHLPMRYEYAFGGILEKEADQNSHPTLKAYEPNPVGRGWIDRDLTDHTQPVAASQIVASGGSLSDPYVLQSVEGFGPIPPVWLPRRPLAGTYDDHWLENVWPEWAGDYDYRFHNSAHSRLQGDRYLQGAVSIRLTNLFPDEQEFVLRLPAARPVAIATLKDGSDQMLEMVRDTVFLDISESSRADPRAYCIWRTPFDMAHTEELTLIQAEPEELARFSWLRLRPDEVACDPRILDGDTEEVAA